MGIGLKKKDKLNEVILKRKENIVYVDFVLVSIVDAIEKWFDDNYQYDIMNINKNAHTFVAIRFYDRKRFSDCRTLGEERNKYLEELNEYIQNRRID